MATKMGFEGKIYYGVAGSTASTEITNSRDITYTISSSKAPTTVRGSSGVPLKTERVVELAVSIEWQMTNDTTDTTLAALRTAAAAGSEVALRTKDYSSGKGFDGDVTLDVKNGKPIGGEQTFDFTATPSKESRTPQAYT